MATPTTNTSSKTAAKRGLEAISGTAPAVPRFKIPAIVTANADGSYLIKAGRPVLEETEITPAEAAKLLKISRPSVYRILDAGLITYRRPSPGKILIGLADLERYRGATKDPEFHHRMRKQVKRA